MHAYLVEIQPELLLKSEARAEDGVAIWRSTTTFEMPRAAFTMLCRFPDYAAWRCFDAPISKDL